MEKFSGEILYWEYSCSSSLLACYHNSYCVVSPCRDGCVLLSYILEGNIFNEISVIANQFNDQITWYNFLNLNMCNL